MLYDSILQKHIGWFDYKANTPGILSAIMANEAQTINGVIVGGLGTYLEAFFAVIIGVFIGYIYNDKMANIGVLCLPLSIFSGIFMAKL